jgi:hypothetical protein
MSAVAALAVASPFAVIGVMELTSGQKAPEHLDFTRAAVVTDLPNEIMSALQAGLSQFGINLPPLPTGLSPAGAQPAQMVTPQVLMETTPANVDEYTCPKPDLFGRTLPPVQPKAECPHAAHVADLTNRQNLGHGNVPPAPAVQQPVPPKK